MLFNSKYYEFCRHLNWKLTCIKKKTWTSLPKITGNELQELFPGCLPEECFVLSYRLMNVEDELRHEQEEMQKVVKQKQKVIEAQERRIQSLDTANNKLVVALNQLKEHYHTTTRNGLTGQLKTKLTTDITSFKTSSC